MILLLTAAVVCLLFNRLSWADWKEPHWLAGDPLEVYARAKIAGEQPGQVLTNLSFVNALGAPIGADWRGYPTPDRIVFVLTGWMGHRTGLIAAVQLMSAFLWGLNAVSLYLCARWLRWRWEWAAALGVAFALCTYNLRWGITLSFNQTFPLPPLVLLCARAARRGPAPSRTWTALGLGLGLWLGQGNPYLAYFAGFVGGGALLLAGLRRTGWQRIAPLVVFLGALSFCFLAANAGHIRHVFAGAENTTLARSLDDMRTYSLRPVEWLVPPADHRLSWLGAIGRHYQVHLHHQGEFFYNYLGVLGIAALLGLIASRIVPTGRRHWHGLDPVLGLLWITAFGIVGGFNYWLGFAGLDLFRASTRIGVFAQVWVFLFLGSWLSRHCREWPRTLSVGLALALSIFSIWDQTPSLGDTTDRRGNLARWNEYRALTTRMEHVLPGGAMIFQLPTVSFPEAGLTGAMPDYEHLLPYLTSATLRYSYGQLRTSPALRWCRYVARLPAADLVLALEEVGFSALWIDTRAYVDGAAPLIFALTTAGYPELTPTGGQREVRVFQLGPHVPAQMTNFADPKLQDPWDEAAHHPALLALHGWYGLETEGHNHWRWATRQASLGIWNEGNIGTVTLRFRLGGPGQSSVVVKQAGREVWRGAPGTQVHAIKLTLSPGLNTLAWELAGRTFRPGGHDSRELGFMVENLSMSVP
ncbi:MAG TPA: hypothetical protein VIM71_10865 [Lacunisphaera sp.]